MRRCIADILYGIACAALGFALCLNVGCQSGRELVTPPPMPAPTIMLDGEVEHSEIPMLQPPESSAYITPTLRVVDFKPHLAWSAVITRNVASPGVRVLLRGQAQLATDRPILPPMRIQQSPDLENWVTIDPVAIEERDGQYIYTVDLLPTIDETLATSQFWRIAE